jgi:hypothetical protein
MDRDLQQSLRHADDDLHTGQWFDFPQRNNAGDLHGGCDERQQQ